MMTAGPAAAMATLLPTKRPAPMMPPMVIIETWRGRSERLSSFWQAEAVTVWSFIGRRVYRRWEPERCEASLAVPNLQALRPGTLGQFDDFAPRFVFLHAAVCLYDLVELEHLADLNWQLSGSDLLDQIFKRRQHEIFGSP